MAVRNCARTQEGQCTRYLQCKHVQADKISADAKALYTHMLLCRFFGGGGFPGFGGFGGMGDEEEQTPKGHDVHVELEVTLKDLYLGHQYKAWPSWIKFSAPGVICVRISNARQSPLCQFHCVLKLFHVWPSIESRPFIGWVAHVLSPAQLLLGCMAGAPHDARQSFRSTTPPIGVSAAT